MIVLLLLIFQLFYLLRKTKWNRTIVFIVLITTMLSIGFMIILDLELASYGVTTYGSDESDYYSKMMFASQIRDMRDWFSFVKADYNFTYVMFGSLILKTSWIKSIILIRLGNVLLFLNTVLMSYLFAKKYFPEKPLNINVYVITFLMGTNGMLIWTAIRNLKDTLFIYMLIAFLYVFIDILYNKNITFYKITVLISSFYVLNDIRQWFSYFFLFLMLIIIILNLYKNKKYFFLFIVSVLSAIILLNYANEGLNILEIYTKSRYGSISIINLPILMGQFMMGPGPIRGLFGDEAFLFTTTTGNILITLGSLAWWMFAPLFVLALVNFKNIKQNYIVLITLVFYWATYSYANAGSGDTRVRAVFYILAMLYTLPYLNEIKSQEFLLKYVMIGAPLFFIGIYFSYLTLT